VVNATQVLPSPLGKELLLVLEDRSLGVLDIDGGKVRHLGQQGSEVTALAWGADGKRVLSGGADGTVHVWNAGASRHKRFDCGAQAVRGLAVSADGRLAAAACADEVVRILPIGEGADDDLRTEAMMGPLRAAAMSDDGSVLLVGDAVGRVALFDAGSGRRIRGMSESHAGPVGAVALAKGGRLAFSGDPNGTIRTWEVATGKPVDTVRTQVVRATGMSIGGDGVVLAWGLPAMSGGVWLSRDGGRTGAALLSQDISVAEISPDRKWVLAADRKGGLAMIGLGDGVHHIWAGPVSTHAVTALLFNAAGDRVICGDAEGTVRLLEAVTGRVLWSVKAHADGKRVGRVAFCPDGRTALSAGDDGMLRMLDLESGQEIFVTGGEERMQVLALAGGKLLSGGSAAKSVRITELARAARYGELRRRVEAARGAGGMTPDYAKALADWFSARGESDRAASLRAAHVLP
jgi:WD40 repeat protein